MTNTSNLDGYSLLLMLTISIIEEILIIAINAENCREEISEYNFWNTLVNERSSTTISVIIFPRIATYDLSESDNIDNTKNTTTSIIIVKQNTSAVKIMVFIIVSWKVHRMNRYSMIKFINTMLVSEPIKYSANESKVTDMIAEMQALLIYLLLQPPIKPATTVKAINSSII